MPPTISSKIGAALSRFISPVRPSPTDRQDIHDEDEKRRFERHERHSESFSSGKEPEADIVAESSESIVQEDPSGQPGLTFKLGDEASFAEIREKLQKSPIVKNEMAGSSAYQSATRAQKKAASFRKGSVLDKKAG